MYVLIYLQYIEQILCEEGLIRLMEHNDPLWLKGNCFLFTEIVNMNIPLPHLSSDSE